MTLTIQAVYEGGVLRPVEPLALPEGETVQVTSPEPRRLGGPYERRLLRRKTTRGGSRPLNRWKRCSRSWKRLPSSPDDTYDIAP